MLVEEIQARLYVKITPLLGIWRWRRFTDDMICAYWPYKIYLTLSARLGQYYLSPR
ncbi:MAG: hypothetical protein ACSLEN_09815 [Candidatus Malihini olakiniferum]